MRPRKLISFWKVHFFVATEKLSWIVRGSKKQSLDHTIPCVLFFSLSNYDELFQEVNKDREKFWHHMIFEVYKIPFAKEPTSIFDLSNGVSVPKYLPNAKFNVTSEWNEKKEYLTSVCPHQARYFWSSINFSISVRSANPNKQIPVNCDVNRL